MSPSLSIASNGGAGNGSARACRNCRKPAVARVGRSRDEALPRSWRSIEDHPTLRPGPWVPRGDRKGVVFCDSCGKLWFLFVDPAHDYYTDVVELAPDLVALVSEDASLDQVLPLARFADALLQLVIRDWFALAHYDRSAAAEALIAELAAPRLSTRLAVRLLDFLAAVLAGCGRHAGVRIADASPLLHLLDREDLDSLDPLRQESERKELGRLGAAVVRAGFGSAFGADRDRLEVAPALREALLERVTPREANEERRIPVLAPPGPAPQTRQLRGVEQLALEIEDLLHHGANRVTCQEIAPIIDVVRSFWDPDASGPRFEPGLGLYRRCRDLLLALRQADLVPSESERAVEEALRLA